MKTTRLNSPTFLLLFFRKPFPIFIVCGYNGRLLFVDELERNYSFVTLCVLGKTYHLMQHYDSVIYFQVVLDNMRAL